MHIGELIQMKRQLLNGQLRIGKQGYKINPLNPACWRADSVSAERVGQGEVGQGAVGGLTRRVLCTWQLLGLVVKGPWLAPGGPILGLAT